MNAPPKKNDELIAGVRRVAKNIREHDHKTIPGAGDLYCLNLTSWVGERSDSILSHIDAQQAEVELFSAAIDRAAELIAEMALNAGLPPCTAAAHRAELLEHARERRAAQLLRSAMLAGLDELDGKGGAS